jgi:hypothetical protein
MFGAIRPWRRDGLRRSFGGLPSQFRLADGRDTKARQKTRFEPSAPRLEVAAC